MNVKYIATALFVLALTGSAWGLNIQVASDIPANTSWGARIDLQTLNFQEAQIWLDAEKVLTVYVSGDNRTALVVHSDKVLSAKVDGTQIVMSFTGLSEDDYILKAILIQNGSTISEQEKTFFTFEALPLSYKQEAQAELERLRELNNQLEEKIQTNVTQLETLLANMNTKVGQLNGLVNDKEVKIQELQITLNGIDESLNELKQQTRELENKDVNTEEHIQVIQGKIGQIEDQVGQSKQIAETLGSGLIALPVSDSGSTIIIVMILAVILAMAMFGWGRSHKSEEKSETLFDSQPGKGKSLADLQENEQKQKEEEIAMEEQQSKGKWAHKEKGFVPEKKNKNKGFGFGDLIKKGKE